MSCGLRTLLEKRAQTARKDAARVGWDVAEKLGLEDIRDDYAMILRHHTSRCSQCANDAQEPRAPREEKL